MRRFRVILLIGSLTLASLACEITLSPPVAPTADTGGVTVEVPAPDPFQIETAVALTLQAGSTQLALPTDTVLAPVSDTPLPTDTPFPTDTQTPQPTTTPFAGDPRQALGDPDWVDFFQNANNWSLYSGTQSKTEIKDGMYFFTIFDTQPGSVWTLSWPEIQDFYLEATALTPASCSGLDRYGLFFRAPDTDHGYVYHFSCDGRYRIAKWDGEEFEELQDWTANSAIHAGPNQTNRIGVKAEGTKLTLYANGVQLFIVTDNDYTGESRFGFTLGSANTDNFVVRFDEIAYWDLE